MAQIVEIRKWGGEDNIFPAWVDTYLPNGERTRPDIICKCGEHTNIENHHIHSDGRITESYFHKSGCGWHVYLKMIDWDGGEIKPNKK